MREDENLESELLKRFESSPRTGSFLIGVKQVVRSRYQDVA